MEYYDEYYKQLDGATIVSFEGMVYDELIDETFPQFVVKLADGTEILLDVASDEECNGAGFLFGLPRPE